MANVMIVFGSGGHSGEMLMLMRNANLTKRLDKIGKLICVISEDDQLIDEKLSQEFDSPQFKQKLTIVKLRRARRVGQSYITSIWTTILAIFHSINVIMTHKPQLCLTNGPAIGLTLSLAIRFINLVTFGMSHSCHIIYVESFCRTKTLSLTGKIIYLLRLADEFHVQWPSLRVKYPRAQYNGIIV